MAVSTRSGPRTRSTGTQGSRGPTRSKGPGSPGPAGPRRPPGGTRSLRPSTGSGPSGNGINLNLNQNRGQEPDTPQNALSSAEKDIKTGANLAKKAGNLARGRTPGGGASGKGALKKLGNLTGLKKNNNEEQNAGARGKIANKVKEKANQAAAKVRRKVRDQLEKRALQAAAETGGASLLIFAATRYKQTAYIIIGIILLFVVILSGDSASSDLYQQQQAAQQQSNQNQDKEPTVTETCIPSTLKTTGERTVCTITVTYQGSADDIQVIDTIGSLEGSSYVAGSSSPPAAFDDSTGTLLWDAKQLNLPLNPINFKVSFKLVSTKDNWTIYNQYTLNPTNLSSGGGSITGGTSCTATGSPNAEAKWQQVLQLGKQYGQTWIGFLNDARSVAQQQDYPLSVIVGQGAHESDYGRSNFAQTRNNFFGFEAYDNNVNAAKSYPNAAASILDYVNLIKGGNGGGNQLYLQAYANRANPVKMVQLIKAGGYATDPNYVAEVTGIPEFQILAGISLPCN